MNKKICLSQENKFIAGVCAGIAEYFDFDILAVRIVTILLALITRCLIVIIYLICWAIFPNK